MRDKYFVSEGGPVMILFLKSESDIIAYLAKIYYSGDSEMNDRSF